MVTAARDRDATLERYRPWLYAAAAYNLLWGIANVLFPAAPFRLLRMRAPVPAVLWQLVGMFVLVYTPGYWWAARAPERHAHLVCIGMLGKVLGPAGFAWAAATGRLPLRFGAIIITNDLLWWPAFGFYLRDAVRLHGGWRAFLNGWVDRTAATAP